MRAQGKIVPYLLLAPALIWACVFTIWPFLNTAILSFTDARALRTPNPVGWSNYQRLFEDERFIYAIQTCLVYVLVCVPLLTFGALFIALLVESALPGIAAFRTAFYFPVVASVVLVGIIWKWIFDSRGIINESLQFLGMTDDPIPFLTDRWKLTVCAIFLTVWKGLGYYMVVYLAALGNVPKELHEAAALDGAGPWRRFWSVTVPGVRGAIILVSALVCVNAMRVFSELFVLSNGSGGPGGKSMSLVMMIQAVGKGLNGQIGYASALSVILFLITIGPLMLVGVLNYGNEIRGAAAKKKANGKGVRA